MHASSSKQAKEIVKIATSIADREKRAPTAREVLLTIAGMGHIDAILGLRVSGLTLVALTTNSETTNSSPLLSVVKAAIDSVRKHGHSRIDVPHLLLAVLDLRDSIAIEFCEVLGIGIEEFRQRIETQMHPESVPFYQALETFKDDAEILECNEIEQTIWSALIESLEKKDSIKVSEYKGCLDENRSRMEARLNVLWTMKDRPAN